MLNLGMAALLLKELENVTTNDIILIDADGTVISDGKFRRGIVHPLAERMLCSPEEKIIVSPDESQPEDDIDPGVYVTIVVNGEKEGLLAVLGTDNRIETIAGMAKLYIEKSLELDLLKHHARMGYEQHVHQLIYSNNMTKEDLDYLVRITHIRPNVIRQPILFVVHNKDGSAKIDAHLVKKAILNSGVYFTTDLLCSTLDNNVIWLKTVDDQNRMHLFENQEALREEIEKIMLRLHDVIYSAYIGPMQDKLQNYSRSYRQCEWMRLDICRVGIYFFNDYILGYLSSKVSQAEYSTIFSALCGGMNETDMDNFCEIMEELISCNYNFSQAAERLHVHKNTVIYRFDKIRNLFGMNPLINRNERIYLEVLYNYLKAYPRPMVI